MKKIDYIKDVANHLIGEAKQCMIEYLKENDGLIHFPYVSIYSYKEEREIHIDSLVLGDLDEILFTEMYIPDSNNWSRIDEYFSDIIYLELLNNISK